MISSTSSSSFDFIRTLRVAGYGLLFLGTSQHLWFNFMSKVLPKRDVLTTFKKVFTGQAVYGPANATLFSPIMQLYKGILCFFPPQGYREAVSGQFFIISHLYKPVEATPEPSSSSGERGDEIVARLKRDLLPTLRNGLLYWPACDFATYKFVLVHPQPLVNIICSYVWDNLFNIHGKLKGSEHGLILRFGLQMLHMFPRLSYRRRMQRLYPFCWFKII